MNSNVIANENALADWALWSDTLHVIYPEETAAYKTDFPVEILYISREFSAWGVFTLLKSISTTTIIKNGVKGLHFTLAKAKDM